eukprot:UN07020
MRALNGGAKNSTTVRGRLNTRRKCFEIVANKRSFEFKQMYFRKLLYFSSECFLKPNKSFFKRVGATKLVKNWFNVKMKAEEICWFRMLCEVLKAKVFWARWRDEIVKGNVNFRCAAKKELFRRVGATKNSTKNWFNFKR